MIKVTHYYSACVAITTPDVSILCDPWFKDGIYDGAWYQYPRVDNPIDLIGKHDIIYVSHIHPDHYDPDFLKAYLFRYPDTKILIAKGVFLDKKMDADGIPFIAVDTKEILLEESDIRRLWYGGATVMKIIPNDTGSLSDIDTALVVKYGNNSVVNLNDNPYWQPQVDAIQEFTPIVDIALIGYTSAGPYPQTYYTDEDTLLGKKEEIIQKAIDERYLRFANALDAKVNIPFAGEYVLGGKLGCLDKYKAACDATHVLQFDPKSVVLAKGATIDTETLTPSEVRTEPYSDVEIQKYVETLKGPLSYETDLNMDINDIPWRMLLNKAARNAFSKKEHEGDYCIVLRFGDKEFWCVWDDGDEVTCFYDNESVKLRECDEPYSIIDIDYRYLFGLVTGLYHWNNAEVGSQYMTTRAPDVYNRSVQRFLNFFHV